MFRSCTNLSVIDCPNVEIVEESGFYQCTSLKSFES